MGMQVQLKLDAIRLGPILFRPNVLEVEDWDNLLINISVQVFQLEEDTSQIVTILEMEIGNLTEEKSKYPFDLLISYAGFFSIESEKPLEEEDIKRIGGINCAAIIFPFLRQEVAELTMKTFSKPLLLSSVNFVALFKEKGVKFSKISKDKISNISTKT